MILRKKVTIMTLDTEDDEEKDSDDDSDVFQDLKLYSPVPDNRVGGDNER